MHELTKFVIPKIMNEWEDVAFALRYDIEIIKCIKTKERGDPKECCREFFKDWLSTNNGTRGGQKTWSTLIKKLEEMKGISVDTVEEICKKVEQLMTVTV